MTIPFLTIDHPPPLLLMNRVRIVTGARSHHLMVYLKTHHHRLIHLRWNSGSPRVTLCDCSWWRWWWCLSFWQEGMVSFVLSHHQLLRYPLPSSRSTVRSLSAWVSSRGRTSGVASWWCLKTVANRRVIPFGWRSQSSRHPIPTRPPIPCSFWVVVPVSHSWQRPDQ